MILALASVVNYDHQSDAPIWSVISSSVNYDRNKFIIQANGVRLALRLDESPLHPLKL
jgi:hypothetical protein